MQLFSFFPSSFFWEKKRYAIFFATIVNRKIKAGVLNVLEVSSDNSEPRNKFDGDIMFSLLFPLYINPLSLTLLVVLKLKFRFL